MAICPAENTAATDQSSFWSSKGVNWDAHRIGWLVAGCCALVTVLISMVSVFGHARHYVRPLQQRQIIRILYMPPVYAIISFFSYRFFRSYTYYELIEVVYEAITITAFFLLLVEYVRACPGDAIAAKDKRPLPIPFCRWQYRPTKPRFMYTIKWCVMQYIIFRPLISLIGIICQHYGVLCEEGGYNFHFANIYLQIADFVSITVALYGLILFYGLTHDELREYRPLAKFLCIKLIVMFTFYQSFIFSLLEKHVIKPTQYWTATNIANGLDALCICVEMVFFSIWFWWAYPSKAYAKLDPKKTNIFFPLLQSVLFDDFVKELWGTLVYFINWLLNRPQSGPVHTSNGDLADYGTTFKIEGHQLPQGGPEMSTVRN